MAASDANTSKRWRLPRWSPQRLRSEDPPRALGREAMSPHKEFSSQKIAIHFWRQSF